MKAQDEKPEREFEKLTKKLFDESAARLDGHTRSRLTQARFRALQELSPSRRRSPLGSPLTWAPLGTAAAAAVAALWLWQGRPGIEQDLDVAALDDLEMLLGEEELDMLEELEFYAWLEEQDDLASVGEAQDGVG